MNSKQANQTHQSDAERPWIDGIFLACVPILLNLPTITHEAISRQTTSLVFIFIIFKNFIALPAISLSKQRSTTNFLNTLTSGGNKLFNITTALLSSIIFSEIIGIYSGTTTAFSFIGITFWMFGIYFSGLSIFGANQSSKNRDFLIKSIAVGLGLYVILNIAGHFAGLRGPFTIEESGTNKILSMIGILQNRIAFPFSAGLNNFGIMGGLCLTMGTIWFLSNKSFISVFSVFSALTFIAIGASGVILVDSRGILLFYVIAVAICWGLRRHILAYKFLKFAPLFLVLAPFIFLAIIEIIDWTGLAHLLQREGNFANRLGLTSGRDAIWNSAFDSILSFDIRHIFGYGVFGQYTSGLTKNYSWIFSQISGQTNASLHNATLQTFFDAGYVGVTIWLIFWYRIFESVKKTITLKNFNHSEFMLISIPILIYLGGLTEVVGTTYQSDSFGLFLVAIAALTVTNNLRGTVQTL